MIENINEKKEKQSISTHDGLFKIGLIPDWLDRIFLKSVTPIISTFSAGRINPNWITSGGFLLNIIAAFFILKGQFIYAGIFVIVGGIFDFVDGKVAAKTNQTTVFGAIFDSILDRYSDMALCLALSIYFIAEDFFILALIAILALIGSIMTSYIKAIGQSHGFNFRVGFLRRQERMSILVIALMFSFLDTPLKEWLSNNFDIFSNSEQPLPNLIITSGVYFLAFFSNLTAIQRFLKLRKLSKARDSLT